MAIKCPSCGSLWREHIGDFAAACAETKEEQSYVYMNLAYRIRLALGRLFYSFFKSLVGKEVIVELKNDLSISGVLDSVDQFLNIKLTEISVTDADRYPHMLSVKNCFLRGSVVRYVQLPPEDVDVQLLQDAARKEADQQRKQKDVKEKE